MHLFTCIQEFKDLPKTGKCFMWGSPERLKKLRETLKFSELPCVTDDREALLIDMDNKTFEVVHKHMVIE